MSTIQERIARLRPTSEHGTAANYKRGCPCLPCRAAHAERDRKRKSESRRFGGGLVSAEAARLHLRKLSCNGVGYRQAAKAAGLAPCVMGAIRSGRKTQILRGTERRILALQGVPKAHTALVSARSSWALLETLREEGYKAKDLAVWYYGRPAIRIQLEREKITIETRERVRKLYENIKAGLHRRAS